MKLTLGTLYNAYMNHPDGGWILKPEAAKDLLDFVTRTEATNVLELGTGIGLSTAIIALALAGKKKPFKITTLEQYERIAKVAQELMPKNLKEHITFLHTEAAPWQTPEIPFQYFSNFKEIPEGDYDLIIVDGPGPMILDGKQVEIPNGDVLRLHQEGKIKPGTKIYYDGRLESIGTLERFYSDNFMLVEEPRKRVHVIERKDNAPRFHDWKKEVMEKQGFKP